MDELTTEKCRDIVTYFLGDSSATELKKYIAFLNLYTTLTTPDTVGGFKIQVDEDHLRSHEYIQEVVSHIRANPKLCRSAFAKMCFPLYKPSSSREKDPVAIIIQLGFMINCNLKDRYSRNRRVGKWQPSRWENQESFYDFVMRTIPKAKKSIGPPQDRDIPTAWKLKDRCKLEIEATENLAEHLLYNPKNGTLRIFHHTSWLHAQLERLAKAGDDLNSSESLLTLDECLAAGALSRQLILETLDSFYRVLFPLNTDSKQRSRKLLDNLIKHSSFDRNARLQSYTLPDDFEYLYWGERLQVLNNLVKNPPPTNWFTKWMERHKAERNVLWIAIIGLFLSAFFGLVSCIIGGLQLWVALIALNQPVP